ncbi:MAG: hypothetical protein EA355_04140 [Rhodobacteraceae bacterium]|nr:MAG: hypothetical protein EA355_04140 [Paracoccaceae bacterium]
MTGRPTADDEDDGFSPQAIWDADDGDDDLFDPLRLVDADVSPVAPPSTATPDETRLWLEAEAGLARPLAEAVEAFARLDERLRAWPPAQAQAGVARLALGQAAALLWAEGSAVSVERLALWDSARIGAVAEEDEGMARAAWAARRLAARRWSLASPQALARFEGRSPDHSRAEESRGLPGLSWRPFARAHGAVWMAMAEDWALAVRRLRAAHPFTQAAFAERAWRLHGLSEATAVVEPGVVAMKLAARAGRGGVPFAPLGRRRSPGGERPVEKLRGVYVDIAEGCREGLVVLERAQAWWTRAEAGVADLSGRTPRRLVGLLAERVAVSAPDAAAACDVSVSAALRNLALLAERGLAREVTGQGRFRMWAMAG